MSQTRVRFSTATHHARQFRSAFLLIKSVTSDVVTCPSLDFAITKCWSAKAATCARCVTTITWPPARAVESAPDFQADGTTDTGIHLVKDKSAPG